MPGPMLLVRSAAMKGGDNMAREALGLLLYHGDTQSLPIVWRRDPSLLVERALYGRWIELWDSL